MIDQAKTITVQSDGTHAGTLVMVNGQRVETRHVRLIVEAAGGVRQTFEVDVDAEDVPAEVPTPVVERYGDRVEVAPCTEVWPEPRVTWRGSLTDLATDLRALPGLDAAKLGRLLAGDPALADPVKIAAAMRRAAEPERCGIVWPSGRRCNLWVRHAGACVIAAEPTAPDATPGSEF